MRFAKKSDFEQSNLEQWQQLWSWVEKCERQNGRVSELKQILAHLHAWHRLLLNWCATGPHGKPDLPAPGYNWRQTPELNVQLDREFESVALSSVRRRLKLSHGRIVKLVDELSEDQFNQPGHFEWTGNNAIASYIIPNTVSHYRWAIKKIKTLV